jgi:HD superfamily phosphohydrolase
VAKEFNEIRDLVHVFVEADPDELAVVDSRPFQRLRHIHQLALTYLIYPGGTHRRFENSLGVMRIRASNRLSSTCLAERRPFRRW